jgi:hypothetical protein
MFATFPSTSKSKMPLQKKRRTVWVGMVQVSYCLGFALKSTP